VTHITRGLPGEPQHRPFLLEEVRSLCFGRDQDTFFAGLGNGGGIWRGSISGQQVRKLDDPALYTYPDGDFYMVENLNYLSGDLFFGTDRRTGHKELPVEESGSQKHLNPVVMNYVLHSGQLISFSQNGLHADFARHYRPKRNFAPDPRALHKRAMYISYTFTQRQNYDKLIHLLRLLKLNAVIINVKDDYGSIRVPTTDPVLNRVPEAVDPYLNFTTTIKRLQEDGIYVIGRMVLFKDEHLYKYKDHKYAIKDTAGHVFLKGPEMWVDPYSEFVWDYNIRAARAIVAAGVNEVQFDYIRFPDIRNRKDTRKYDFKRPDQTMREALVSFLKKARENINVPISIDLFGYNAISKMGNWIGQDITEMSRYVDVVSPMFYPSHYGGSYAADYGDKRIYYIIYLSCKRTKELIGDARLRPYIQAFYYKDNSDNYCVDYIGWELDGLKNAGLHDFIFWNNLHEYETLIRGLRKYQGLGDGPLSAEVLANIPHKLPFSSVLEKEAGRMQKNN
ncbi:MAG: putative glycoside hydrolase, partial [Spirochaetia bacterium]